MGNRSVLGILFLVVLATAARAEPAPVPLADINQRAAPPADVPPAAPTGFLRLGDRLLFSTTGARDEGILWSTDGTAEGTHALSSPLCPFPCSGIKVFALWKGTVLLETISGRVRLWRTDGTASGTIPLTGPLENNVYSVESLEVTTSEESSLFFFVGCPRGSNRCVLMRSDGTRAGTVVVQDLQGNPFYEPHSLTFWQGRLYFVARSGEGSALFSTDGSAEGTRLLGAVGEDLDRPSVLQATPSHLFFGSGYAAEDLWVTDGTVEGTRLLADLDPSACSPPPGSDCVPSDLATMLAVQNDVFFVTRRRSHGVEIWRSDGSESGTRALVELPSGSDAGRPLWLGGRWLLPVSTAPGRLPALWTAEPDFSRLQPLGLCSGGACPVPLAFLQKLDSGAWLFSGRDDAHGDELWLTDGTGGGTRLLKDVCPGPCSGYDSFSAVQEFFGSHAGRTYFNANGGPAATGDDGLWSTDGSPEGTHQVGEKATDLGFLDDGAIFGTGGEGAKASEIWTTDGTAAGTRPVLPLQRFEPGSNPAIFSLGERTVLLADEEGRQTLWASDGQPEGTSKVFEVPAQANRYVYSFPWVRVGGRLFFVAQTGVNDLLRFELWRTDGTTRGTGRVTAFPRDTAIELPLAWNGKLLFRLRGPESCSIGTSDGTAAGTRVILPADPRWRCPTAFASLGSRFVFVVRVESPQGYIPQIFVSDGTRTGTRQVSSVRTPRDPFEIDQPVVVGGVAFFRIATPGSKGTDWETWRTDGTPAGTYRAFNLRLAMSLQGFRGSLYFLAPYGRGLGVFRFPAQGGNPVLLAQTETYFSSMSPDPLFAAVGDRLLFVLPDLAHGSEPWSTDGTPEGTGVLRDLLAGPRSSEPAGLVRAGGRVYFSAEDGVHGRELWVSDGTPEGTRLAWDLNPGGFSSRPEALTVAGDFLFFSADDGKTGFEPWALLTTSPESTPRRAPSPASGRD